MRHVWGQDRSLRGCDKENDGKNHSEDLGVDKKIILSGSERNVMGGPGMERSESE